MENEYELLPSIKMLSFWRDAFIVVSLAIAGIYLGQKFLIPLTLATILFVLLISVADKLSSMTIKGIRIPKWAAYIFGISIILFGFLAIVRVISNQASHVVAAIPRYEARFDAILDSLTVLLGKQIVGEIVTYIQGINISHYAGSMLGSASVVASTLALVLIYVPFMIAERKPLGRKIKIAVDNPRFSSEITEISRSVSFGLQRYISIKTFVSILTGLYCYVILKFLGIDFAETWAILTFALNYIPSIGSVIAVIMPAIVSLVQFDTLTPFLVVVLGCGVGQFLIGNVLEPTLTGKSLNISAFLVILSLTFWSVLWGVPGAFLSVPITVSFMILFANIPSLRWLAVLMSSDGDLAWIQKRDTPEKIAEKGVEYGNQG